MRFNCERCENPIDIDHVAKGVKFVCKKCGFKGKIINFRGVMDMKKKVLKMSMRYEEIKPKEKEGYHEK